MDLIDRQLEHEMEFPLAPTPIHDTAHLEGLNALLTYQDAKGETYEVVLKGRVADPERFFETLSVFDAELIDVSLTNKRPTEGLTPGEWLANARHDATHH